MELTPVQEAGTRIRMFRWLKARGFGDYTVEEYKAALYEAITAELRGDKLPDDE